MDKIRPILKSLYVHRVRITCGLVALASLATWYLASDFVEKERAKNAQNLDNKKRSIDSVLKTTADTGSPAITVQAHPNQRTIQEMDVQIAKAADGALEAWKYRYQQQSQILKFPEELPQHIRQAMAKHSPPEKLPFGEKDPIDENMRYTFMENIVKRMPALARVVGSKWIFDESDIEDATSGSSSKESPSVGRGGGAGAGAGGRAGGLSAETAKVAEDNVIWDASNQELWNAKVTQFRLLDGNKESVNRPTTHQMLAVQQDLWILEAMLEIIAKVNEGIEGNDLVPIERIDHILIGKDALAELGTLSAIEMEVSAGARKSGNAGIGGISKKRERSGSASPEAQARLAAGGGKKFDKKASDSPFHGRYVDRNYEPLSADDIRQVMTANQLSERSYLAVAKRVPVRVAVIMDERKIRDFLAAAANSPFNFEVRQFRLNKHVPGEGASARNAKKGGSASPSLSRGGGGGGMSAEDDAQSNTGGGSTAASMTLAPAEQRNNFDVKVEFVGIVKMYNPVNPALLGVKEDQAKSGKSPETPPESGGTAGAGL